jgi:uncharacterized membrane protein YdcZ (DUF606 family)
LKVQFWLIAMACGGFQVLQAMTNGAAARAGIGAIWVGVMSATVSALTLVIVAVAIYRLPLPAANLLEAHGLKAVAGGMMGAFILAGLTFVAPRLGPSQTFISIFSLSQSPRRSLTASASWERKPGRWRLDSLSACCWRVSASCSPAPERRRPPAPRSATADAAAARLRQSPVVADRPDTIY